MEGPLTLRVKEYVLLSTVYLVYMHERMYASIDLLSNREKQLTPLFLTQCITKQKQNRITNKQPKK